MKVWVISFYHILEKLMQLFILLRCFDSTNIQHVNKKIDPINDLETIKTEILLSDIGTLEKKLEKTQKKMSDKEIILLEEVLKRLNTGENIKEYRCLENYNILKEIGLISIKPYIIVCNVDEENVSEGNNYTKILKEKYPNEKFVIICADIEDQITELKSEEKELYMKNIGLEKTGLNKLINTGYDLLI